MTLVVGLRGSDGLVLAADSRGTIGDPRGLTAVNDVQQKMFRLSTKVGVAVTGAAEVGAKLIDQIGKDHADLGDIEAVVQAVRGTVRRCYDDWFEKFAVKERPGLGLLIGGFTDAGDQPAEARMYMLSSQVDFAPQLFATGIALAGVVNYGIYLAHRFYSPDLSIDRLSHLAAFLITETASQDPKVGGPVKIATITADHGYMELGKEEIERIGQKNEQQREAMRVFFAKGDDTEPDAEDKDDAAKA